MSPRGTRIRTVPNGPRGPSGAGAPHREAETTAVESETATAEPITFPTGHHVDVAEAIEMRSQATSLRAGAAPHVAESAINMSFPRTT